MKDHFRMVGALVAIGLVLTAMVVLVHQGQKLDAMASLGFGVVLGNLTGAFSPSFQSHKNEPTTRDTVTVTTETSDKGQGK
jgi:hypothetical protein